MPNNFDGLITLPPGAFRDVLLTVLFIFVFQLCGCGLLGVGIWLSVSQGNFATFSPSFPSLSAANLVIAIGTIVMVTGFLGCLGAIKENKCLLLSVSLERNVRPLMLNPYFCILCLQKKEVAKNKH